MYEIFKELETTSKTNEKIEILKKNAGNVLLQECFKLMLNETLFYIKKIPMYEHRSSVFALEEAIEMLSNLSNRHHTGNAAIEYLQDILTHTSPENADVIKRIIKKDPNCGVSYKTVNKVPSGASWSFMKSSTAASFLK